MLIKGYELSKSVTPGISCESGRFNIAELGSKTWLIISQSLTTTNKGLKSRSVLLLVDQPPAVNFVMARLLAVAAELAHDFLCMNETLLVSTVIV